MRLFKWIALFLAVSLVALTAIAALAQQTIPYSVVQIQKALNDAGYGTGKPDGIWGKRSAKALKQFQKDKGIETTGKMDPVTMSKLFPIQEALRKKLETPSTPADDLQNASESIETFVVTPIEKADLPPPAIEATAGLNQASQELVTMLRLADYGIGSCKTGSFDAAKISRKLIDAVGVDKFTEIENELRTKGSDIARGYPARGTDFPSNTCSEWERMAKSRGVDKVEPVVEPTQPETTSEDHSTTTSEPYSSPPRPRPQKSNFTGYLVIGGIVLALYLLFRGRKKTEPSTSKPTPTEAVPPTLRRSAPVAQPKQPSAKTAAGPSSGMAVWMRQGQSVSFDGRSIRGGFFYFGSTLRCMNNSWANENCLIDPTKEITKGRADIAGQYMTYWPSYSDIPPSSRKAYLDWLDGPRSDPNTQIGYVFLYFYGLERRAMLDATSDDGDAVIAEVRRLLGVYGSHGSFRRYATALLDAHALRKNGFKETNSFEFDVDGGELPLNLRVALGIRSRDERPVEPDLLLAFIITHPETRARTPARRAFALLKELFGEQIRAKYPNGYLLKSRRRLSDLAMTYRAASNTFEVSVVPGGIKVPDVMEMEAPLVSLRAILDDCTEKLDAYSRELAKSQGMKPTLSAVAKLPRNLRLTEAARLAPNPVDVLHRYAASAQPVAIDVLSKQIGNGALVDPSRAQLTQLSTLLAAFGFGWTADPAFTLRNGKLDSTAVVFRLDDLRSGAGAASEPYLHTRMLLQIGMIIANADGVVDEAEKAKLDAIVEGARGVSMEERRRLKADLVGLERDPGSVADWTKRLKEAPLDKRRELGVHVAYVAQADGVIGRDEVMQLEKLFKIMGIDQQELYQHLHGSSVIQPANDDLPVTIIPAGHSDIGADIPAPPIPAKKTAIDLEKLAGIRSETMNTATILGDIFRDENDVEDLPHVTEEVSIPQEASDGLDGRQRAFLRELLTRAEWPRPDFDGLAKRMNLMPSAVTEAINEWAYERFDDLLISGEDPVHVERSLIPESEFGEAA